MPDPVKENGTGTVSFNLAEAGNISIAADRHDGEEQYCSDGRNPFLRGTIPSPSACLQKSLPEYIL